MKTDLFSGFAGVVLGVVVTASLSLAQCWRDESRVRTSICSEMVVNFELADTLADHNIKILHGQSLPRDWVEFAQLENSITRAVLADGGGESIPEDEMYVSDALAAIARTNFAAQKVVEGRFTCLKGCKFTERLLVARYTTAHLIDHLGCETSSDTGAEVRRVISDGLSELLVCPFDGPQDASEKENCRGFAASPAA